MASHVRTPHGPLAAFVDFFWIYEAYAAPHAREHVMPTATLDAVFALDAKGRMSSGVAGARSEAFLLDTSQPFSAVGIRFRPGGGFPFFGVPAGDLHNQTVPLDALWGSLAARVGDQLWQRESPESRFRTLERALLERAGDRLDGHPAVAQAITLFETSNGAMPVDEVVQRLGLSQRRLGELFWNEVGLSPKRYCRVRRFNGALRRIEPLTEVDWTDVALSCGYFDQAHFNHDFRAFAGMSPSAYLCRRVARNHVAAAD